MLDQQEEPGLGVYFCFAGADAAAWTLIVPDKYGDVVFTEMRFAESGDILLVADTGDEFPLRDNQRLPMYDLRNFSQHVISEFDSRYEYRREYGVITKATPSPSFTL